MLTPPLATPLCYDDWRVSSGWQQIISTSTLGWSLVVTPTLHILHFCTTGVTSSVTPLTLSWLPIHNLYLAFCFSSEILGHSVLSFSDGFRQLDHCNWRGPQPTDPWLMKPLQRFIPGIEDQSSILSSFPFVLLQVLQVTVYSPPLCFSLVSTSGRSERWLSVRQNVKVVRF